MATYIYKAKKNAAETVTGQINAQNQDEAIELISQLGFLPVSVVPKTAQERTVDPGRPQKVKAKELYTFSRQLANLLKSGVSIIRALEISEQQTTNAYLKKVVQCI